MEEATQPRPFEASDISFVGSNVYRCEFNFPQTMGEGVPKVTGDTTIEHSMGFDTDSQTAQVRLELYADLALDGQAAPVHLGAEFKYHVKGLSEYLKLSDHPEDRSAEVETTFASILIGISLSTLRGIWSSIARQTPFPDLHIRVYDPLEILNGPMIED